MFEGNKAGQTPALLEVGTERTWGAGAEGEQKRREAEQKRRNGR